MRIWLALLLTATSILFTSCASTPVFGSLSPEAAAREAWNDIASDRMKIYLAGTRATSEVGVEPEDRELVRKVPRNRSLPSGCDDPNASAAVEYARAYNIRIVRYLRMHHAGEIAPHVESNQNTTQEGAASAARTHRPWWKLW